MGKRQKNSANSRNSHSYSNFGSKRTNKKSNQRYFEHDTRTNQLGIKNIKFNNEINIYETTKNACSTRFRLNAKRNVKPKKNKKKFLAEQLQRQLIDTQKKLQRQLVELKKHQQNSPFLALFCANCNHSINPDKFIHSHSLNKNNVPINFCNHIMENKKCTTEKTAKGNKTPIR